MTTAEMEVRQGKRFKFGKNWQSFLSVLNDQKIEHAQNSLIAMLGTDDLHGKKFLDIGSGSGLSSLVARRMGAEVHSFDYDSSSVACTEELRRRYFSEDPNWIVEQGSALDQNYLESLGSFDVVYSWGVLHHTGSMWAALENVASLVNPGGTLFIALYNDQGRTSRWWKKVKQCYCSGVAGKIAVSAFYFPYFTFKTLGASVLQRKNVFIEYKKRRGMSVIHDWVDWIGGLPFEVASVEEIFHFYQDKGFTLKNITAANGYHGNNQFVFAKD